MNLVLRSLPAALLLLGAVAAQTTGQAPSAGPIFSSEQAATGRAAYQLHCASCHAIGTVATGARPPSPQSPPQE
jgi:mono/diheme cytochrome c family protein